MLHTFEFAAKPLCSSVDHDCKIKEINISSGDVLNVDAPV